MALGAEGAPLPAKRGDFAFRYASKYTPEEMAWYSRFDVVVTGDFLPAEQVKELNAAGCRLLYYEWLVAFYQPAEGPENSWEKMVLEEHREWLLNPDKGLLGHAGSKETPAYYFDPAVGDMCVSRVRHIIEKVREHGYAGVFFDTTGFGSVHPDAQAIFTARHPSAKYDYYIGRFLSALRRGARDIVIFTNQGYRNHRYYLPYADYDLTESYMTTAGGPTGQVYVAEKGPETVTETYVHPWYNAHNLWDSVSHYCRVLINDPLRANSYRTQIRHLNYGQPRYERTGDWAVKDGKRCETWTTTLDREALHYGVAAALLMGQSSYYEVQPGIPADEVYFVDLGKPVGSRPLYDARLRMALRVFDNGFAVVNDSGRRAALPLSAVRMPRDVTGLWDVFRQEEVEGFDRNGSLPIPPSRYEATDRTTASGRVYGFLRKRPQAGGHDHADGVR